MKKNPKFLSKEQLREKKVRYLPKNKRPQYTVTQTSNALTQNLKNEQRLASKAHKLLYEVMPMMRKNDKQFDENITRKIIWEYLRMRCILLETRTITSVSEHGKRRMNTWIYFPMKGIKKYVSSAKVNADSKFCVPYNKMHLHCVICEYCRRKLSNRLTNNSPISINVLNCVRSFNKCKNKTSGDDVVAASILFRFSRMEFHEWLDK